MTIKTHFPKIILVSLYTYLADVEREEAQAVAFNR